MPQATRPFHNRLAVVFDFDDTLAHDSFDALVESLGYERDEFRPRVEPLSEAGWDDTLARAYALIQEAGGRDDVALDREHLQAVGRELRLFDGVPELFDRVRETARAVVGDVEVEFYLLTCGFLEIARATEIAGEFEAMWGSELHYGDDGRADFVKQIVSFPEKVRYLLALSKGLDPNGPNAPADVYRPVEPEDQHLPLDQLIYLGDGGSDMPVFDKLHDSGGLAIGIVPPDEEGDWSGYEQMYRARRVENLAPADFSEGSQLLRSLLLAVEATCKLIALRRLGIGE